MRKLIINSVALLIIFVGGLILIQPAKIQAQTQSLLKQKKCTVEQGEDPCAVCFGGGCHSSDELGCGILRQVGTNHMVSCTDKSGPSIK